MLLLIWLTIPFLIFASEELDLTDWLLNVDETIESFRISEGILSQLREYIEGSHSTSILRGLHQDAILFLDSLASLVVNRQAKLWGRVTVIGGGPSGLVAAIEAQLAGWETVVFEKREKYTRNQWIDLVGRPFYKVMVYLNRLGWRTQRLRFAKEDALDQLAKWADPYSPAEMEFQVVTTLLQDIERFLSKVALLLGADIRYGEAVWQRCTENLLLVAREQFWREILDTEPCLLSPDVHSPSRYYRYALQKGDIILAAWGSKLSELGSALGLPEPVAQSSFTFLGKELDLNGVHQISLRLDFAAGSNGSCPEKYMGEDGEPIDPWAVGFSRVSPKVIAAYKRFWKDTCELQILLAHPGYGLPEEDYSQMEFPWDLVLQVLPQVLETPPTTVTELQAMIIQEHKGFAAETFAVEIHSRPPIGNNTDGITVLPIGDALSQAHYRLGVGVNAVFQWAPAFAKLLREPLSNSSLETYVRTVNQLVNNLLDFQLSTMFAESYCDMIVFFDSDPNALNRTPSDRMIFYQRNYRKLTYVPLVNYERCRRWIDSARRKT